MCHYSINWNTASGNSSHDLLRDNILNELKINRNDILSGSINPSISTPLHPFTVGDIHGTGRPLARPGHEMCISSCISFQTTNGNNYKVEELYYKDDGHRNIRDRLFRIFHYNCEVILTDENNQPHIYDRGHSIILNHIISGARYIEVIMPPTGNVSNPLSRRVNP